MKCPNCGQKLNRRDVTFCPSCGRPVPKRGRRWPKALLSILTIALVISALSAAGFYAYQKLKQQKKSMPTEWEGSEIKVSEDAYYWDPSSSQIVVDDETGIEYVNDELLVYCEKGVDIGEVLPNEASLAGATVVGHVSATNSYQVRLQDKLSYSDIETLCEQLKASDNVRDAVPHLMLELEADSITNDPAWVESSDWFKPSKTWGLSAIHAPEAWDIVTANADVRVGVMDSQFYSNHEDLSQTFVSVMPSSDGQFSLQVNDDNTHGTHVAGIIGAESNDKGSVGVAYGCSLYGYSVLGSDAYGNNKITSSYSHEVGLAYLVDMCGCRVINMSFGNPKLQREASGSSGKEAFVSQQERLLASYGMITSITALIKVGGYDDFVICKSAGNEGQKGLADWDMLGCIDDELVRSRIIIVGSLSEKDNEPSEVSWFSSCGKRVDVLAPGNWIYSTTYASSGEGAASIPVSDYGYMRGTSQATPIVSGVAALVIAANPKLKGNDIKNVICSTTGQAFTDKTGVTRGIVDAEAAVREAKRLAGAKSTPDSTDTPSGPSKSEPTSTRNIAMVLDVSSSMEGEPLTETKQAAIKFVDQTAGDGANLGLVTFSNSADIASAIGSPTPSLKSSIRELESMGGTNIEDGLQYGSSLVHDGDSAKRIIVLMSDGEPNDGLEGEELISYARSIRDRDGDGIEEVKIYALGFNENASGQYLLANIASPGCHYEVQDASDLTDFFADIADEITGTRFMYVRIACPVDVTVISGGEILSSSGEQPQTRASFGSLTFEQELSDDGYAIEDDPVKVLRLREGADYDIKLEGYDSGIMNYSIGFLDDAGNYSDFRTFPNIQVSSRSQIQTQATVAEQTTMLIDDDGDGHIDRRLRASANQIAETVDNVWVFWLVFADIAVVWLLAVFLSLWRLIRSIKDKAGRSA